MEISFQADVSVRSVISDIDGTGLQVGEPERAESSSVGTLTDLGGGVYRITYTESTEGGEVNTTLEIEGEGLTLRREGALSSHMRFREGEEYKTLYSVPPYSFDMIILPRRVDISASRARIDIRLVYDMTVGGVARRVNMRASAVSRGLN